MSPVLSLGKECATKSKPGGNRETTPRRDEIWHTVHLRDARVGCCCLDSLAGIDCSLPSRKTVMCCRVFVGDSPRTAVGSAVDDLTTWLFGANALYDAFLSFSPATAASLAQVYLRRTNNRHQHDGLCSNAVPFPTRTWRQTTRRLGR